MMLTIELTTAQVATLEFLRERSNGYPVTNAQLAQRLITEALARELSGDSIRQQWAHWLITGTMPQEDDV